MDTEVMMLIGICIRIQILMLMTRPYEFLVYHDGNYHYLATRTPKNS